MRLIRLTKPIAYLAPLALTYAVIAAPPPLQINPLPFTPSVPTLPGGPIGFSYAGNKFVGSILDNGTGTNLLYSTDLSGNYTGLFAPGVALAPSFGSEHYVSSSLGLGGFPAHDVYVAEGNNIHHFSNTGADLGQVLGSLGGITGDVRGITFDTSGNYGYNMLVTTHAGYVYSINSAGLPTQLAFTNEDTEGLDVSPQGAGAKWGALDGVLFVASEISGTIRAIKPANAPGSPGITIMTGVTSAEQLDFVPLNLGTGGPLEGMYSANYALNVLKAPASQFNSPIDMRGDIIITSETTGSIFNLSHNLIGNTNSLATVGNFPVGGQPEDGLFVTAGMINSPEPASLAVLALGGLTLLRRRAR